MKLQAFRLSNTSEIRLLQILRPPHVNSLKIPDLFGEFTSLVTENYPGKRPSCRSKGLEIYAFWVSERSGGLEI